MMPAFPQIEKIRDSINTGKLHKFVADASPLIGQIKRQIIHEGKSLAITRFDETSDSSPMQSSGAKLEIAIVNLEEFTTERVDEYLKKAASQLAEQGTKYILAELDRITKQTGLTFDGKGRPLDEDMFLSMLESMEHQFTPEGIWAPPTVFMSPESADGFRRRIPSLSNEGNRRLEEILIGKRDEFFSREASRVLVG